MYKAETDNTAPVWAPIFYFEIGNIIENTSTLGKSSNRSHEKSNILAKISKIQKIPLFQEKGI